MMKNKKTTLSELRVMFLIFKFTRVCALAAVDKAKSVHNFKVRCFMSNEFKGKRVFKYLRTLLTSHVNLYLGRLGLKLNKPFINFVSKGEFLFQLWSKNDRV